jgi:DNA-binding CsgD family transcriptional regulator
MALGPKEIAELLKMRALGFSQAEIADKLKTTQQNIAYHLKKLREKAEKNGTDEAFNAALIGGLVGATAGIATFALLELLKNQKE